jgi:hypothetical protein
VAFVVADDGDGRVLCVEFVVADAVSGADVVSGGVELVSVADSIGRGVVGEE